MIQQAVRERAALLVLSGALLTRDNNDPDMSVKSTQPLDGAFLQLLLAESECDRLTTVLTLHMPSAEGRVTNTLVVLRDGEVIAHYHKLYLYDAFAMQESQRMDPGQQIPPVIEVVGLRVGLMTRYDLHSPGLALSLALNGAELLVLPITWVRGPQREYYWATLLAARALDTTCYIVAVGECGTRNIGQSRIVDSLGTTLVGAGGEPQLISADVPAEHLAWVRECLPVLQNRRFAPPQLL